MNVDTQTTILWLAVSLLAVGFLFADHVIRNLRKALATANQRAQSSRDGWNIAAKGVKALQARLFREWAYRELLDGWDEDLYDKIERSDQDILLIVATAHYLWQWENAPYYHSMRPRPWLYAEDEGVQRSFILSALKKIQTEREPKPETQTVSFEVDVALVPDVTKFVEDIKKALKP